MKNREEYLTSCLISILLICAIALFVSCGTASNEDGGTTDVNPVENVEDTVVSSISLKLSQISIKSDDSDSTTITATIIDNQNAVMEGVTVNFSSQGGELNRSEVVTDENGEAEIIFSSGTEDKSNRTEVITATAGGQTRQIPINITGTTVTLSTDMTNLEIGGDDTAILTIKVKDAGLVGINNAEVTVSINNQVSTGIVTFESIPPGETSDNGLLDGIYTDFGELKVKVKGIAVGDVTVTITSMNTTATQTYKVGALAEVFRIIDPTNDPCSLKTESEQLITVNAPTQTRVRFATSMGVWDGGQDISVIKDVSNGSASAILSSAQAGIAIVQVIDPNDPSITDSLKVVITVLPAEASQIALQASAAVVAPSTGNINNTITLTAQVRNENEAPVGGAPVGFAILKPTGGGETIMPAIVYTNDSGSAAATFTSGSLSSGAEGVEVEARVLIDGNQPADKISIVIGGIAGSIMIGRSTKIKSNETNTTYHLPMSVMVADTNGNPVYGIQVSLNLWPVMYRARWIPDDPNSYDADDPDTWTWNDYDNEDKNKNLILDPGEDLNDDGQLTPPNSSAGTVPTTVTTDEYGVANFDLVYLKASAVWINTEITATTFVYGTETQSTYGFWLTYDIKDEDYLPECPYKAPDPNS